MLLSTRNYGPTVLVQQEAQKKGCEQVLWLYGPDHELTEALSSRVSGLQANKETWVVPFCVHHLCSESFLYICAPKEH